VTSVTLPTVGHLARAMSAVAGEVDLSVPHTGVVTDTRGDVQGKVFLALRGDRFDGHDFAPHAVAEGAVAVVADRPIDGLEVLLVKDTRQAYSDIAAAHLRALRADGHGPLVVGITGSSGKTSTKDLIAHVLEPIGTVIAPEGSLNNEIGLPATVLRADASTQALVLEMGMRGIGHIAHLCDVAPPDIGVVLNVGSAHLGELGGREAIAAAKGELVSGLAAGGVAVLNADDPLVRTMSALTTGRVFRFGESVDADVRVSDVALDDLARATFVVEHEGAVESAQMRLHGEHHVSNAAAAAAVGLLAGMDLPTIVEQLRSATPRSRWRMEVSETLDGITIVNDAYNANPESMRAALKSLVAMAQGRRTWAILGEMRELGADAGTEHDALGRLAVRLDVSRLIAVGDGARLIHMGAAQEGSWAEESIFVPDIEAALEILRQDLRSGDVVLVKASRSIGLERVAERLLAERGTVVPS
jgi:UDP-N-acetylmuramoyl-tripeptide--D-alanyl-D-alanine ligase